MRRMKQVKNVLVEQFIKEHKDLYGSLEDELLKKRVFSLLDKLKNAKLDLNSAELVVEMAKERIEAVEKELAEVQ